MRKFQIILMLIIVMSCKDDRIKIINEKHYKNQKLLEESEIIEEYNNSRKLISKLEYFSSHPDFKKVLLKETNYKYDSLNHLMNEKVNCPDKVGGNNSFEKIYVYDPLFRVIETKIISSGICSEIEKYFYSENGKLLKKIKNDLEATMIYSGENIINKIDTIQSSKVDYKFIDSSKVISDYTYSDSPHYCIESNYQNGKLINESHKYSKLRYPTIHTYYRNSKGLVDSIIIKKPNEKGSISLAEIEAGIMTKDFFTQKCFYYYDKLDSLIRLHIISDEDNLEKDINIKWK
jgi:hypothetical protein